MALINRALSCLLLLLLFDQCFCTVCTPQYTASMDTTQDIASPNYPSEYDNLYDCVSLITADIGYIIRLDFSDFELESYSMWTSCRYDYLEIRDGDNVNSFLLGNYCGTTSPGTIESSGNALYIKFHTDSSITRTGYYATFTAVKSTSFSLVNSEGEASDTLLSGLLLVAVNNAVNAGTVCDDYFSDLAASAICQKMGFHATGSWSSGSVWPSVQETYDIVLDDVNCQTDNFGECSYLTTDNCQHYEDVFLTCEPISFSLVNIDGDPSEDASGLLLVAVNNGNPGTVCDDYFSELSASAICEKMGYDGDDASDDDSDDASSWTSGHLWPIVQDAHDIVLDNVNCETDNFAECSYDTTHNCVHIEDVFLTCEEEDVIEWCQYPNSLLDSYSSNIPYSDLSSAQAACLERSDCGGITQEPYNNNRYTLRVGPQLQEGASTSGETAWVVCEKICSTNFPFPYLDGEYCCKNNVDCNDGPLETSSDCCFEDRNEQCEHTPCVSSLVFDDDEDDSDPDNLGTDTDCTADYPFPFLNGLHCCKYNLDCRRNSIEEVNDCCFQQEKIDCVTPPCSCYLEFDDVDDPYYDDDDD